MLIFFSAKANLIMLPLDIKYFIISIPTKRAAATFVDIKNPVDTCTCPGLTLSSVLSKGVQSKHSINVHLMPLLAGLRSKSTGRK